MAVKTGTTIVPGQRYRMRFTDQMAVDARLAYMLMRVPERLPEGVFVHVKSVSDNGRAANIYVQQVSQIGGQFVPYGPVLSYPAELFKAWFQKMR